MHTLLHVPVLLLALMPLGSGCGDGGRTELIFFVAPSLARVVSEVRDDFLRDNSGLRVRMDISGSQVAARKITELSMQADLLLLADADVIERMLVPTHADFSLRFATTSIVLAHLGHSRFTEEVTAANWPEVLSRPGVRVGLASPDLAPIGYRALIVWQLAAAHYGRPDLPQKLRAQVTPEHVVSDEAELWALLPSRAVDYVFLYRTTAEEHRLKATLLPDAVNLSQPTLTAQYATASVPVRLGGAAGTAIVQGEPLFFGLAVPKNAPHREAALRFVAFLLSERGRRTLIRCGFSPVVPAQTTHRELVPESLLPLTAAVAAPLPAPQPRAGVALEPR